MRDKREFFWLVIKWGIVLNLIFIALKVLQIRIYWAGWTPKGPQTWYRAAMDNIHTWLHSIPQGQLVLIGFILGVSMCLLLSVIED